MLSQRDDYPLQQVPDVIRHVGSSDWNFYDRYCFDMHGSSTMLFERRANWLLGGAAAHWR